MAESAAFTWEIRRKAVSQSSESTTDERLVHTLITPILMLSEDMSILDGRWWFREKGRRAGQRQSRGSVHASATSCLVESSQASLSNEGDTESI